MGFLGFLKKVIFGISDEKVASLDFQFKPEEEEISGLNFKTAIDAHMNWKKRLKDYIEGKSNENLEIETIAVDNVCVLGKWIYSEGQNYKQHHEMQELQETHARFHRQAALILAEAKEGRRNEALKLLEAPQGEYTVLSNRIKKLLLQLYVKLTDHALR